MGIFGIKIFQFSIFIIKNKHQTKKLQIEKIPSRDSLQAYIFE